jgi:beta-lactamase class A
MTTRRNFVAGGAALGLTVTAGSPAFALAGPRALIAEFRRIEREIRGRLGVSVLYTASDRQFGFRSLERFPMCSTFKLLAAALVLWRVDQGNERLDRHVPIRHSDIIAYSPAAEQRVGNDMTVAELCEAAVTLSDNTAANLLLASFGGPHAVTAFARSLGDRVTRLDRKEPALNESIPRDPRDTTTPTAMLGNIRKLVLGDALTAPSRKQLTTWLVASKTGGKRLRAELPDGWRAGEKTGTGGHGSTNDVGVIWPPRGGPIVVAAYLTQTSAPPAARDAAIAAVGKAVAAANTQFA